MIDEVVADIRETVKNRKLYIAFSGGEDSSLVAILAAMALGKENIELLHIDWGLYEYEITRKIVAEFSKIHDFKLTILDGKGKQKDVWKYGPSCNSCTKFVKIPILKSYAKNSIIATGSNSYDSWGKTGIKLKDGIYAPLYRLEKKDIRNMLRYLGIKIKKIGESEIREGCKLKHLLKMLVKEEFHGKAVALANEALMDYLKENNIKLKKAAVKIIGPLSKNIAVVVTTPSLEEKHKRALKKIMEGIKEIDEIFFLDSFSMPQIKVVASPPIYKNIHARENIKNVIDLPGNYNWIMSKNTKLRTFQVVEVEVSSGSQ